MVQLLVYFAYLESPERYAGAFTSESFAHVVPSSSLLYTGSVCPTGAVSLSSNVATMRPLGSCADFG
ncbi:hypothetical protein [Streptomyces humi]|uniref:hypothetical protein n=1 Tax=Streptomyces humi TaxID=1428620 RepID=UPI0006289898